MSKTLKVALCTLPLLLLGVAALPARADTSDAAKPKPILVQGSFIFAYAILAEAALSFLGVGVPPDIPTWGTMVAGSQQYAHQALWIVLFPGLAIIFTALSLQVVGDGIRDLLQALSIQVVGLSTWPANEDRARFAPTPPSEVAIA